ncbi:MAG: hypothetical protein AAGD25_37890 [Cyanobacteria bacterium P01_F01_bin.150]
MTCNAILVQFDGEEGDRTVRSPLTHPTSKAIAPSKVVRLSGSRRPKPKITRALIGTTKAVTLAKVQPLLKHRTCFVVPIV